MKSKLKQRKKSWRWLAAFQGLFPSLLPVNGFDVSNPSRIEGSRRGLPGTSLKIDLRVCWLINFGSAHHGVEAPSSKLNLDLQMIRNKYTSHFLEPLRYCHGSGNVAFIGSSDFWRRVHTLQRNMRIISDAVRRLCSGVNLCRSCLMILRQLPDSVPALSGGYSIPVNSLFNSLQALV